MLPRGRPPTRMRTHASPHHRSTGRSHGYPDGVTSPDLPVPPGAAPPTPPPTSPPSPAGWFPDPNGRHEHRYFNGRTWTADVADAGRRAVDPLGAGPSPVPAHSATGGPTGGNGIATAALVCGLIAVLLAWMPFIVVAGLVLAVLGVVFGVQGLRRANAGEPGRGKAIAGIVLGAVGLALSVLGVILSVIVFREVSAFIDPVANRVEVAECQVGDGVARVSGTITNLSGERADFSLFVEMSVDGRVVEADSARQIGPVEPGASAAWRVTTLVDAPAGPCTASVDVFGPMPFGVEMDRP